MLRKAKREKTDSLNQIRPKRKDHPDSRGKKWIKQNEYDAICTYLNSFSDKQLADFIKQNKPKEMPGTSWQKGVTHYHPVRVPLLVDGGVVHWIAKAIIQERANYKAHRNK